MKLEDQVCSLELSKQLNDLSVKQESLWYWGKYAYGKEYGLVCPIYYNEHPYELECSAFTVAELGEMLPKDILVGEESYGHLIVMKGYNVWHCVYDGDYRTTSRDTLLANAMAKMLIWCIENKKVKI